MLDNKQRLLGYQKSRVILDEELTNIAGSLETCHATFLATTQGEMAVDSACD